MRNLTKLIFLVVSIVSAASADTQTKLRIGHMPITDHLLLGIAKEHAPESLDTLRFTDYPTLTETLRSGDLDGAIVLAPLAFQLRMRGSAIKVVLLGHRDGSAFVVQSKASISGPTDLKGTTIAVPNRFSTHSMFLHMYTTAVRLIFE